MNRPDTPSILRTLATAAAALGLSATAHAKAVGDMAIAVPVVDAAIVQVPHDQPSTDAAARMLAVHNQERDQLGLPPLKWNASLASDANAYAKELLSRGKLAHSEPAERKGNGENLWMGTAGVWNPNAMVEMFLDERRYFRPATFPDVSLTGNWTDVGHYSQIVWKETREVGCAIDSGNGMDVLVCRYSPAGNVYGQMPF